MAVHARAVETARDDAIVRDEMALRIVRELDYDFSRFARAWKTQVAIAVRTEIIDGVVSAFVRRCPDAVVVNLGSGLDSRFTRLDNGTVRWYELDLPPVMALRRRFFRETDRYRFIETSVLDPVWLSKIDRGPAVLFIAEAVLMYLDPAEVRAMLAALIDAFPGAEMVAEVMGTFFPGHARLHDAISKTGAALRWGLRDGREIAQWDDRIRFVDEWSILDKHPERWRWLRFFARIRPLREAFSDWIVHLRFKE